MSTHQNTKIPRNPGSDTMTYNLRCNRNVSEKMTKKDFVYDMRPATQPPKKPQTEGETSPTVSPIQLKRKQAGTSLPLYAVVPSSSSMEDGSGDASLPGERALGFECNFCQEPIATLLSLSTHVKFHCRRYCKICYWIPRENETLEGHIERSHRVSSKVAEIF